MLTTVCRYLARRRLAGLVALALITGFALSLGADTALAQEQGQIPGNPLGYDSDFWRAVRQGTQGTVSIPDKQAGVLVQSEGDNWRAFRNGPLSVAGGWAMLGIIIVLALFFLLRGRIRIDAGRSKRHILRFNNLERAGHWLLAVSFIILAFTGLNVLYGRYVLKPVVGPQLFADITVLGKYLHNYVAFAFMLGLLWVLVLWIKDNLPNRYDFVWLIKGGGLFARNVHPPARKFNAGQKILFWLIVLGGISISITGIALMFPFQFSFFAKTFGVLNAFGLELPTDLAPIQEMQLNQLWHAIMGLFLMVVVIAHIYLGTIGMEGAFDAMGSGEVDENWAKEHHALWVEELKEKEAREASRAAAE